MTEKNKNLILDLILLDKYTKNIEYWNPFIEYKDINFFISKSNYYILAPLNIDNEEYLWNFRIRCYNNNKIVVTSSVIDMEKYAHDSYPTRLKDHEVIEIKG